jgi:hypothetical protein
MPAKPAPKPSDVSTMTLADLRAFYRTIRERSEARSPIEFDRAVVAYLGAMSANADETENARAYVRAALAVRFPCRRCAATGRFVTYVENGVPRGPGGPCFRCAGRGTQSDEDVRRNYVHDCHYMARAV